MASFPFGFKGKPKPPPHRNARGAEELAVASDRLPVSLVPQTGTTSIRMGVFWPVLAFVRGIAIAQPHANDRRLPSRVPLFGTQPVANTGPGRGLDRDDCPGPR